MSKPLKKSSKKNGKHRISKSKPNPKPKPASDPGSGAIDYNPKLTAELQQLVIQMLGRWSHPWEVIRFLKIEYNVDIKHATISYYKKRYADDIAKVGEDYMKQIAQECPVSQKAYRLKMIQRAVDDIMVSTPSGKNKFKDKLWIKSSNGPRPMHDALVKLLTSAREEMEPRKVALTDPKGEVDALGELSRAESEVASRLEKLNETIKQKSDTDSAG